MILYDAKDAYRIQYKPETDGPEKWLQIQDWVPKGCVSEYNTNSDIATRATKTIRHEGEISFVKKAGQKIVGTVRPSRPERGAVHGFL